MPHLLSKGAEDGRSKARHCHVGEHVRLGSLLGSCHACAGRPHHGRLVQDCLHLIQSRHLLVQPARSERVHSGAHAGTHLTRCVIYKVSSRQFKACQHFCRLQIMTRMCAKPGSQHGQGSERRRGVPCTEAAVEEAGSPVSEHTGVSLCVSLQIHLQRLQRHARTRVCEKEAAAWE